jgi:hypothetical protein
LDDKQKFDVSKFNPEYFSRLDTLVMAAGEKGIYVSVLLFEGWGVQFITARQAQEGRALSGSLFWEEFPV